MQLEFIEGGVTAPLGFVASGLSCGIRKNRSKNDLALVFSQKPCTAAGVFTQNRVQAECVKLSKEHLQNGHAQALIANSGNANACTGKQGADAAARMAQLAADQLGIAADDVIVYSTGVIGEPFPIDKVASKVGELASLLSREGHKEARTAILTTDTHYKECAVKTTIGGKSVTLGSMAKGSGMIHINMGTMLSCVTTDCAITSQMLSLALKRSVEASYNCVSIDGDTSTNDSLTIMANGMAGNELITAEGEEFAAFCEALDALNVRMAKKIAGDGEGATKLIECNVRGAKDVEAARGLAKAVVKSNLAKAAIFGSDANFGRFLCAMGYSGYEFDPLKVSIAFESAAGSKRVGATDFDGEQTGERTSLLVFQEGSPVAFDEELAKKVLSEAEVHINIDCQEGSAEGTAWGCDLTYEYVKINGDYRT